MFRYYLKLGLLSIRANPALSSLMVAAVAIGIGACMTIVTVRHVMSDNPIAHKNDVLYHVQVDNWNPADPYQDPDLPPEQMTYLDAKALYEAGRAFRQTTSYRTGRIVQPDGEDARPFTLDVRATTSDFFPMFDVPFAFPNIQTAHEVIDLIVLPGEGLLDDLQVQRRVIRERLRRQPRVVVEGRGGAAAGARLAVAPPHAAARIHAALGVRDA